MKYPSHARNLSISSGGELKEQVLFVKATNWKVGTRALTGSYNTLLFNALSVILLSKSMDEKTLASIVTKLKQIFGLSSW